LVRKRDDDKMKVGVQAKSSRRGGRAARNVSLAAGRLETRKRY
jgi:hypothetical protein